MASPISDKKPQRLYLSTSPQAFKERFEGSIGLSVDDLIARFVSAEEVVGALLVGSIPLGIGSSASDIDLLVLLDSPGAVRVPSLRSDASIVFAAPTAGGAPSLVVALVVTVLGSMEIDIAFVPTGNVLELCTRLGEASPRFTPGEARTLSRLRHAWVLTGTPALERFLNQVNAARDLERHCARRHVKEMQTRLEEAAAALCDNGPLALHLGRCSAEAAFRAYLASKGYAAVGRKWLRFLRPGRFHGLSDDCFENLLELGLPLLFPKLADTEWERLEYLERLGQFTRSVIAALELDSP